jgi:hypothetical protein
MGTIKPHEFDPERWDEEETGDLPIRKQSDRQSGPKDARRQQQKEWGKAMHKFHKQRPKREKP